jgi:hypothetical protein
MTDQTQTPAPAAPRPAIVTIDDVRQQLDALQLDARKTNASVIQKALGRGGMSTVQKHLEAIRAELNRPVAVVADGEIPAAPKEAVDTLWRAAWSAAQLHTATALATVLMERDQARQQLETAHGDLEALTASQEAEAAAAAAAAQVAQVAQQAQQAAEQALERLQAQAEADGEAALMAALQAQEAAQSQAQAIQAAHALEIAHFETRIATLQGQLDRVNDQLAEVKSLLPRVQQQ